MHRRGFFTAFVCAPAVALAGPQNISCKNTAPVLDQIVSDGRADDLCRLALMRLGLLGSGELPCKEDVDLARIVWFPGMTPVLMADELAPYLLTLKGLREYRVNIS